MNFRKYSLGIARTLKNAYTKQMWRRPFILDFIPAPGHVLVIDGEMMTVKSCETVVTDINELMPYSTGAVTHLSQGSSVIMEPETFIDLPSEEWLIQKGWSKI